MFRCERYRDCHNSGCGHFFAHEEAESCQKDVCSSLFPPQNVCCVEEHLEPGDIVSITAKAEVVSGDWGEGLMLTIDESTVRVVR